VRLATGDAAGLCLSLSDHGRDDLVGVLRDRAQDLSLCSCHSFGCLLDYCQLLLHLGNFTERTVIVFDLT
jgi:hypothetical protein